MLIEPFAVVKQFEQAVADYTGAPFCVAVNSCTMALFLCLKYQQKVDYDNAERDKIPGYTILHIYPRVEIPKLTYISVPMQIVHTGHRVEFRDEDWHGIYQLDPYPIWDSARRFTSNMYCDLDTGIGSINDWNYMCTSHHWSKTLGIQQGGCILHNDPAADAWFRRARFDGRSEGIEPHLDTFDMVGWHCYMAPEIAAAGLVRLAALPRVNGDLRRSNYPDLSKLELFK